MTVYHWQDESGAWHVGAQALAKGFCITRCNSWVSEGTNVKPNIEVLMKHWPTNELEWVPESKLKPYPSEPIPEPTK